MRLSCFVRAVVPAVMLWACSPLALPPPSFMGGVPLTSGVQGPTTELGATAPTLLAGAQEPGPALFPSLSIDHAGVTSRGMVAEVRGQLTMSSVTATPGLWVRGAVGPRRDTWLGVRVGASAGLGDLLGELPFRLPYAGPTCHVQVQGPVRAEAGAPRVGLTIGGEYTVPIFVPDTQLRNADGNLVSVARGTWLSAGLRTEWPLRSDAAMIVGISGYWLSAAPAAGAQLDLGVRLP